MTGNIKAESTKNETDIGLIGLGAMGSGIAHTLLEAGFDLWVYDIDNERVSSAVAEGALATDSIMQMCAQCSTILLSLPSSDVTVSVIEADLIPVLGEGSIVIDLGTTRVEDTQRLHALSLKIGAGLIDAPVSGGVGAAATGELFVFAGGDRNVFEACTPVFTAIGGGRVTYCGPSGSGQITKAVNQLSMGLAEAAYMEALAFGVNAGVNVEILDRALGGDGGFRKQIRQVSKRILEGNGDMMDAKSAEYPYFLDEADRKGFATPVLKALHEFTETLPKTARDNMNRPYAPLWSALVNRDV